MTNWTTRQRILASFAVILALMVVMGGIAYTQLALIEQKATTIQLDAMPGLYSSAQIESDWLENYSLTQGHILQSDMAVMRKLESQLAANWAQLPDSIELIARIRYHSKSYLNQVQRDHAYHALRRSQQQLQDKNLELLRLSNQDGLTGLSNRRFSMNISRRNGNWPSAIRVRSPY